MMVPALGNLAGDACDVSLRVEVMARANHFTGNFPQDFKFKSYGLNLSVPKVLYISLVGLSLHV
jgi:hypothetical protein